MVNLVLDIFNIMAVAWYRFLEKVTWFDQLTGSAASQKRYCSSYLWSCEINFNWFTIKDTSTENAMLYSGNFLLASIQTIFSFNFYKISAWITLSANSKLLCLGANIHSFKTSSCIFKRENGIVFPSCLAY